MKIELSLLAEYFRSFFFFLDGPTIVHKLNSVQKNEESVSLDSQDCVALKKEKLIFGHLNEKAIKYQNVIEQK